MRIRSNPTIAIDLRSEGIHKKMYRKMVGINTPSKSDFAYRNFHVKRKRHQVFAGFHLAGE
jgi:hypothetical protein